LPTRPTSIRSSSAADRSAYRATPTAGALLAPLLAPGGGEPVAAGRAAGDPHAGEQMQGRPGSGVGVEAGSVEERLTFRRLRAVTRQDEIVGRRPTASKTSDAAGRRRVRVPSVTLSNPAGAGSDDSQGSIGLAVPGPPIRSLVAEDRSAGGVRDQKDRTPMLTSLLTGRVATLRDERIQDGTMVRRPPGLEAFVDAQRAPASTPRGQFRSRCASVGGTEIRPRGNLFEPLSPEYLPCL
jgi:hypothetical protein